MEKEYRIRICGNECTILSTQNEETVHQIASLVEEKVSEILASNERVSVSLAAVLGAMTIAEELFEEKENSDNLRSQIKTYLDDASKAISERDNALAEIERLRREVDALRARLTNIR